LRLPEDIDRALQKLISSQCDTVITMVDVGAYHPARMYRIENDRLVGIMEESIAMRRRQDLPPIYIRSGDVYACKRDIIFNRNSMLGNDCRPLVISPNRAINIDTLRDIVLAEYLLK
jgi:N-acylneuraminate cytidylyltransferase